MFVQGFDFPPLSLRGLLAYPHTLDGDLEIALRMVGAGSLEGQKSSLHEPLDSLFTVLLHPQGYRFIDRTSTQ